MASAAPTSSAAGAPVAGPHPWRRALRDSASPVVGGVASGLARHLGLPSLWVRVGFVVAAALGGLGVFLYAGLWVFLPSDSRFRDDTPGAESAERGGRRPGRVGRIHDAGPTVALAALAFGGVLVVEGIFGGGTVFWPVAIGLAGLTLLWRQADEAQRERWLDTTGRVGPLRVVFGSGGWAAYARVAAGVVLVGVALLFVGVRGGSVDGLRTAVVAGLLGVGGLALVVGPSVLRLAADLSAERAERIRTQERADVAAHLHDSVLQTLALIQKSAEDPATVARLARAQERDLRSWLYAGESTDGHTVAGALRGLAAEVEDTHDATVDVVAVGDCPLDDPLRPIVAATREAVVNAARHAGTDRVDVYAEVGGAAVEVFVRDRGVGFDVAGVPADRLGVRGSILGRMQRHGGTAEIRSAPGDGTEVRLRLPRTEARTEPRTEARTEPRTEARTEARTDARDARQEDR